jgi:hypothetical protein
MATTWDTYLLIYMGVIVLHMLKETHTISYIQQASHEWIEGDEEEISYVQATESLKVVPTDI